jgi:predicted transcriptional regulator
MMNDAFIFRLFRLSYKPPTGSTFSMTTSNFTPYGEFLNTAEETQQQATKKPSLNALVLSALQGLQAVSPNTAKSAKQVHAYITDRFHYTYPVQTITVILSRFTEKTLVQRLALKVPTSRQRYRFYLVQSLESLRNQELLDRFKPIADEFFGGNLIVASQYIATLVAQ